MLITGGVFYEDGSSLEFTWDDSRQNPFGQPGQPYWLLTFTHDTFSFSRTCCGSFQLMESAIDAGDIFGDSIHDTWQFYGIDLTQDDYHFSPEYFRHSRGNHDGWRPDKDSYQANAVRSYMNVLVPEPSSASLLLIGAIGLLARRKAR